MHLYKVSDIGDVDSDFERPVLVLDDVERVVEIFGRLRVDGEDAVLAEVTANLARRLACDPKTISAA